MNNYIGRRKLPAKPLNAFAELPNEWNGTSYYVTHTTAKLAIRVNWRILAAGRAACRSRTHLYPERQVILLYMK